MKCKDYQEAIAGDPSGSFDGSVHADACASCATFRDSMRALDLKIAQALDIPVPELSVPELPPIGGETANVAFLPFRHRLAITRIALAASVVLAAVLGIHYLSSPVVYPTLGAEILAHLDHEPASLTVTDVPVSDRQLQWVLNADVSSMDSSVGIVSYARTCVIHGHKVPHLVIQGRQGPITVLLLPDEKVDTVVPLEGVGTEGVILPVGDGSIAIIGERGERLEELEERLSDSVKWRT